MAATSRIPGRRIICVDLLHYNEDGTMQRVEQTEKGVSNL